MKGWVGLLNLALVLVAATLFAAAHGGQLVRIDLGIVTFRRVSLSTVVFVSVLVGMAACLLVGLRADLRNRRRLRRYREMREED